MKRSPHSREHQTPPRRDKVAVDSETRIEQFKKMADADPNNELGHFSLGKAYFEAGRYAEAEPSFARVLELNETFSKAYQFLGETRLKLERRDDGIRTLRDGYVKASQRGDVMPRDEIAKILTSLGEPLPEVQPAAPSDTKDEAANSGGGDFKCSRCGRPNGKMAERPFRGALGEKILANTCEACWAEWIGMGTKVINEMGLPLADPRGRKVFDEHLTEFLGLE